MTDVLLIERHWWIFPPCSHDCRSDGGWLRIGVTEVRGAGFSAILEIIASVSAMGVCVCMCGPRQIQ